MTSQVDIFIQNQIHVSLPGTSTATTSSRVALLTFVSENALYKKRTQQLRIAINLNDIAVSVIRSNVSPPEEVILSSRSVSTFTIGESLTHVVLVVPFAQDRLGQVSPKDVPPLYLFNLPPKNHWVAFPCGRRATGITNTCNFESFLVHVIYLHRCNPRYFARGLNLVNSRAKQQIKQNVRLYSNCCPLNTITFST